MTSTETVLTGPPVVTLRSATSRPYDDAIAAARTCYSPHVVGVDDVTPRQRETIGPLTFDGGHHTVYQHAHFEFGLENVSRQFVWSFLHSHPFYNSEQSSQRFVRLDEIRAFVPEGLSPEARRVYDDAVVAAWSAYRALADLLRNDTHAILSDLRHLTPGASEKRRKKVDREAEKKAIEVARYVIPVAAFTSMVHTLSGIVLHRLYQDDADRRRAAGDTGRRRRHGGPRAGPRPRVLRARRRRAAARRTRSWRGASRAARPTATRRPPRSTTGWERARRCWSTTWPTPRRRRPTPCARCWESRPATSPTTRPSTAP